MDYKYINDYEQLYLISENDDEAKKMMFDKYKPIVISLANKYYNYLSKVGIDIEDLIQEGYIGLSNAIKSFKDTKNACFYTFSSICIERQIRAYSKKYMSNKNMILNMSYSIDDVNNGNNKIFSINIKEENAESNPDLYLINTYYNEVCVDFKHMLSLKDSLIFELRVNGFKYREISKLLDVSLNTVDNSIHRIKGKLLNYLNK